MPSNRRLRVGVIGLGNMCRSQHLPHWHSHPHCEIVAVCDIDPRVAQSVQTHYGAQRTEADWRTLVTATDLDIVDIAAPNVFHAPMALAALQSGKHVYCEKPMAVTASGAERMLNAARSANRLLMINHCFRYQTVLTALRAARNRLGDIYHVEAKWVRRRGIPNLPTFTDPNLAGGGPIFDLGIHLVDLGMWFLGEKPPISVTGSSRRLSLPDPQPGVEEFATGLFSFEGGSTLFLETAWLGFYPEAEQRSLRVMGTKGSLYWPEGKLVTTDSAGEELTLDLSHADDHLHYGRAIRAFADAVLAGHASPIPPEDSLQAVRMMEGLTQAAAGNGTFHFRPREA